MPTEARNATQLKRSSRPHPCPDLLLQVLPSTLLLGSCLALIVLALVGCGERGSGGDPSAPSMFSGELASTARSLAADAAEAPWGYGFLRDLTTEIGPRFAGSGKDLEAAEWAQQRLQAAGFENVRLEPVVVPRWVRGEAQGEIVAPYPQQVVLTALGGSVGTPVEGLEAPILEVANLAALEELPAGAAEGKIVFINHRMRRARTGAGYGETVPGRGRGPARAAEKGAVGLVIRSSGTSTHRFAHTGGTRYEEGVPRIPAAALSNADADLLARQVASGQEVVFRLVLGCRDLGTADAANVVAEIPGRENPEEIVLLAAHLDSWDLGTGAIDDGLGCAVVAEAARRIGELPQRPRRTIRVLLTANEEFGLDGARAYAERHALELEKHVAAIEADFGTGKVWAFRSRVADADLPVVADLAKLLAPMGIEWQRDVPAFGGADLMPLAPARVPLFDLALDGTDYFDYHHTADDTFDKVDPEALAQAAAAYSVWAYAVAEMDAELGRRPSS